MANPTERWQTHTRRSASATEPVFGTHRGRSALRGGPQHLRPRDMGYLSIRGAPTGDRLVEQGGPNPHTPRRVQEMPYRHRPPCYPAARMISCAASPVISSGSLATERGTGAVNPKMGIYRQSEIAPANVRQPPHTTSKDGQVTKRLGILIAVIAALVAGGLALGLGLISNSHGAAINPTPAAHTTTTTTSTPPPPTTLPPAVPPTTVPPAPPKTVQPPAAVMPTAAPPPPPPTTAPPPPPPTTAPPAPPTMVPPVAAPPAVVNGIAQGNGGDQDADNNGGPSDGDGNL